MPASTSLDGKRHDYYLRQLRDWKVSLDINAMPPDGLRMYAAACGRTLARAHARTGDRIAIAAYLGGSAVFDQAIADFAASYADLNERDYESLQEAVRTGKIAAQTGV
jgi:Uncharacterized protein conserved in bacteria (DUF2252)